MRLTLRSCLATSLLLAATAGTVEAAPSAGAVASARRTFSLGDEQSWDRLEVQLSRERGGAEASVAGGRTRSESWTACVDVSTRGAWFYDCSRPLNLSVTVADTSVAGRIRFTLKDDFWGDTADVDLTLTDSGAPPEAGYEVNPYTHETRASVHPGTGVTRIAVARGTVKVRTVRGRTVYARTLPVQDMPVHVTDWVSATGYARAAA